MANSHKIFQLNILSNNVRSFRDRDKHSNGIKIIFDSEINNFENGREQLSKGQLWDFLKIKFKEFTQKFNKKSVYKA